MKSNTTNIAIVVLAAGESSRMGKPKQLLPWGDSTLLNKTIKTAQNVDNAGIFVVLGSNSSKIESRINAEVSILINTEWKSGIGTSISTAVKYIAEIDEIDGILFMLVDQPLISSEDLLLLIDAFGNNLLGIIASKYSSKKLGVPAIFGKTYFEELSSLEGDIGASKLIASHMEDVFPIKLINDLSDVDTPKTYKSLFQKHHTK